MSTWRDVAASQVPPSFRKPLAPRAQEEPKRIETIDQIELRSGGRTKHQSGQMNKLESLYAQELEARRLVGDIHAWHFEAVKLKLAPATFYTPDFMVLMPNFTLQIHEVKGHWEDDARVKIKVAARLFPGISFYGIRREKGRNAGWAHEVFLP